VKIGLGIIGGGLIGNKRARALGASFDLIACYDAFKERADRLAKDHHARSCPSVSLLLRDPTIQAVVISTLHDSLAPLTLSAVRAGKHVLVEKPAARSARELLPVLSSAKKAQVQVRLGYNHRFHRAFRKAREIVDAGKLGPLMMIRARYGHGGRLGYEKEWRADPKQSGGGELIDQGVHLIDLARWFLGDFKEVDGFAQTLFWKMTVDDNAFLLLKTGRGQTASLHASCTEWKNLFSFEIYGRNGKLHIEGLGGSYGLEKLTWYRMLPQMGPPETKAWEFPRADDSWEVEMNEFAKDIRLRRSPQPGIKDGLEALKIVDTIYRKSQ
jgi:predicted dehydrogenase